MLLYRRFPILYVMLPLILALALVFSCSEQPTGIENKPAGGLNGKGTIDPGANGKFLLGSVSDTVVTPGRIEVWAMNVAFDDSTGIVTFDVQLLNRAQRDIHPMVNRIIQSSLQLLSGGDVQVQDEAVHAAQESWGILDRLGGHRPNELTLVMRPDFRQQGQPTLLRILRHARRRAIRQDSAW